MPLYDYECPACGLEFEALQRIANRKIARCPRCVKPARLVLPRKAPGLSLFQPGFWRDIDTKPIWIETPQQLREELDKRGAGAPLLKDGIWKTSPGEDHEAHYQRRKAERRAAWTTDGEGNDTIVREW